jgi:hypothetical protein
VKGTITDEDLYEEGKELHFLDIPIRNLGGAAKDGEPSVAEIKSGVSFLITNEES